VVAVVDALAQHAHAEQPGANNAEEAQQQPPAQRLVPQSAAEAQGSPGEKRTHEPVPGRQAAQPSAAAAALQQKPPRHAPAAHVCGTEGAQGAPGGCSGGAEGEAAELRGSREMAVGICATVFEGSAVGVADKDALPELSEDPEAEAEARLTVGVENGVSNGESLGSAESEGCVDSVSDEVWVGDRMPASPEVVLEAVGASEAAAMALALTVAGGEAVAVPLPVAVATALCVAEAGGEAVVAALPVAVAAAVCVAVWVGDRVPASPEAVLEAVGASEAGAVALALTVAGGEAVAVPLPVAVATALAVKEVGPLAAAAPVAVCVGNAVAAADGAPVCVVACVEVPAAAGSRKARTRLLL
jgi:hypothetical protein